jgi:cell division protein FtsN
MNREELLKRCVDRRVAHETSVVAVSHLFYVYLLSALKKGQRVEVPNFGTFGTHVVGVRRQRRMPYFEVEEELANKVNERYRNLKTLVVGRYEMIPVEGEVEYTGKEPKYDRLAEEMGETVILDTDRDITPEEYRRELAELGAKETEAPAKPEVPEAGAGPSPEVPPERPEPEIAEPPKERKLMPKQGFDLRDKGTEEPTQPVGEPAEPMPTLREISGSEGPSAWLQILLGAIMLGIITLALNEFGVIRLWGRLFAPKPPQITETLPPPAVQKEEAAAPEEKKAEPTPTPTPTPTPKEEPTVKPEAKAPEVKKPEPKVEPSKPSTTAPTGTGRYTVQVSSWTTSSEAERAVSRLKQAGFEAYVVEAFVKGRTWYRVRVGRYATMAEAQEATSQLRAVQENGVWVTKFE